MTADLTPAGSAAVRLADALVRTKKQRDRARDLACAYEAQLAKVWALAAEWERRGEYGDISLTQGARRLREVLDVPDD